MDQILFLKEDDQKFLSTKMSLRYLNILNKLKEELQEKGFNQTWSNTWVFKNDLIFLQVNYHIKKGLITVTCRDKSSNLTKKVLLVIKDNADKCINKVLDAVDSTLPPYIKVKIGVGSVLNFETARYNLRDIVKSIKGEVIYFRSGFIMSLTCIKDLRDGLDPCMKVTSINGIPVEKIGSIEVTKPRVEFENNTCTEDIEMFKEALIRQLNLPKDYIYVRSPQNDYSGKDIAFQSKFGTIVPLIIFIGYLKSLGFIETQHSEIITFLSRDGVSVTINWEDKKVTYNEEYIKPTLENAKLLVDIVAINLKIKKDE